MKYCKYCGSPIEDDAAVCPKCGKELPSRHQTGDPTPSTTASPKANATAWLRKPVVWIGAAVLLAAVVVLVSVKSRTCKYGSCSNNAVPGFDYCYSHKCALSDCDEPCFVYSNYCYAHYLLYDDDAASNSNYVPSYQLKISGVTVYSSSNFTYAEGTITNNSDTTVSYVKIKGAFETRTGTVVDTDWTYAVGGEGLAPGESCKWKLSVTKDSSIQECKITILDYDY